MKTRSSPLQREFVPALPSEVGDHRTATGLLPQPLEYQRRFNPMDRNLDRGVIGERTQHHRLGRNRAPERNRRSNWPLACRSSKRPSVAITC